MWIIDNANELQKLRLRVNIDSRILGNYIYDYLVITRLFYYEKISCSKQNVKDGNEEFD